MIGHNKQPFIIIPFLDLASMTIQAGEDAAAQRMPQQPLIMLMDNGSQPTETEKVSNWAMEQSGGVLLLPCSGTLSRVWNRALNLCWKLGAEDALVMNNDARITSWTYETLRNVMRGGSGSDALFVSAVNVAEDQWLSYLAAVADFSEFGQRMNRDPISYATRGGPDYSCFLISKDCHQRFPFDEQLTYRNDIDHHRRIMLAGEGRRIFSIPLPYRHLASQTIHRTPEAYAEHCRKDAEHEAYYFRKWGGGPNQETFADGFSDLVMPKMSTPELQRRVWGE